MRRRDYQRLEMKAVERTLENDSPAPESPQLRTPGKLAVEDLAAHSTTAFGFTHLMTIPGSTALHPMSESEKLEHSTADTANGGHNFGRAGTDLGLDHLFQIINNSQEVSSAEVSSNSPLKQ